MKQQWAPQELIDHWTLTGPEKTLTNQYHTDPNRIASALLLKFFSVKVNFRNASKISLVLLSNTLLNNFIWKPQFLTPTSGERERLTDIVLKYGNFSTIPGGRYNPVNTEFSGLSFRKHLCNNTPLTETMCGLPVGGNHGACCTQRA